MIYFIYLLFILSIFLSIFKKKIGYALSAITSIIFVYYGITIGNIYGYFFIISGLVWLFSSIFSIFYDTYGKWLSPLFITSILGMAIALTARTYIEFLAGWEIMTIPAYAIIGLNRKLDSPAFIFMGFGELSTILIFAGFIYAYTTSNSFYFTALDTYIPLIVVTFGFMIKMGIFPFLVTEWLPIAHGNSPANASAILSATMTLVAAYGIVKMMLLSPDIPILGYILMGIGGFSIFFGALYAYISEHVKGLLAFSTIENNGAILSAIGVYMTYPTKTIAEFALDVIVTFAFAHSIAKTGLFMISGTVEGEALSKLKIIRNKLGEIGGILLASSMSGLLPNIGGVATWSLLESLFMEAYILHSTLSSISIITGSVIAMGEGFASAAMIKFISYTQVFKGITGKSAKITIFSIIGFVILILGSLSYLLFRNFIYGVPSLGIPNGFIIISEYSSGKIFGDISPFYVLILIVVFSLLTLGIFGKPKVRKTNTWNNGIKPREEYTAFAFANNIRLMLSKLLRTEIKGDSLETSTDIFWKVMYYIAKKYVSFSRRLARSYMNSSISWYIIYMILAFILITILVVIL